MKMTVAIAIIVTLTVTTVAYSADRTSACLTHLHSNEYKDAIRAGEEAIRLDPSDSNAFICLALVSENLKNYGRAITYREKAIQRKLDNENTSGISYDYEAMARVYSKMGNKTSELKYTLLALESAERQKIPNQAEHLASAIALMYNRKGEYEKAVQYEEKSIQYTRSSRMASRSHWWIANIYAKNLKRPAAAIEHAKIAISLDKDPKYAHSDILKLADFYALNGNYDLALQHYMESINSAREIGSKTGQADGVCYLARFYKANHKTEDSIRTFEECIAWYKELKFDNGIKAAEKELAALKSTTFGK